MMIWFFLVLAVTSTLKMLVLTLKRHTLADYAALQSDQAFWGWSAAIYVVVAVAQLIGYRMGTVTSGEAALAFLVAVLDLVVVVIVIILKRRLVLNPPDRRLV